MTVDLEALLNSKGLEGRPVKLDIGAGGPSGDTSFLSVDLFTEADIAATMWDIPLPDKSVDEIICINALEHVSKFDVIPSLREFNRLLKVGGKLLLVVPDLEWSCKWWLGHQDTSWNMDIIFGNQQHEGEFHKTGFTLRILYKYIGEAGGLSVHKLDFMGGENFLCIKEDEQYNSLVEHVEQRQIVAEISKRHDWQLNQQFESTLGYELSTEMTHLRSSNPLENSTSPEVEGVVS